MSLTKGRTFIMLQKDESDEKPVTFALPDRVHALLIVVAKRAIGRRLKVPGVHPTAGHRITALAHAGVVP